MTMAASGTGSVMLSKGGPGLIDLLVDVTELRIIVTGPRMLFERLDFLTTLSVMDGATGQRLVALADCLEGTIHCGRTGVQPAEITVTPSRTGAVLQIGLGPATMYQTELVLRTLTGETFATLLRRLLPADPSVPFFAGLHGVTATGHLEHQHDLAPIDEPHGPVHDHH